MRVGKPGDRSVRINGYEGRYRGVLRLGPLRCVKMKAAMLLYGINENSTCM